MKLKNIFIVLISLISIQTLAFAAGSQRLNNKVYDQSKQIINLTPKQKIFTIKLSSNRTTGYAWSLINFNSKIIKPLRNVYVAPQRSKMVGVAGYELWTFQVMPQMACAHTSTNIRFAYQRPWIKTLESKPVDFKIVIH